MRTLLIAFICALCATTALAEEEKKLEVDATGAHVWSRGVPEEHQIKGTALIEEGNDLYTKGLFMLAITKYEESFKYWQHPGAHYMLAICLRGTNRPLEAYQHLIESMKYGAFGDKQELKDLYKNAQQVKAELEMQLVKMRIKCDTPPGATVEMDGRTLFTGPGSYEEMALPGPHAITAKKPGYATHEISRSFSGGTEISLNLNLMSTEAATEYHRRWPGSKAPLITLISGAVVAGGGVATYFVGRNQGKAADNSLTSKCSPLGCTEQQDEQFAKGRRARTIQKIGVGASIVGAVGMATGGVLLYLNRLRPFPVHEPYKDMDAEDGNKTAISPLIGVDYFGISAQFAF